MKFLITYQFFIDALTSIFIILIWRHKEKKHGKPKIDCQVAFILIKIVIYHQNRLFSWLEKFNVLI